MRGVLKGTMTLQGCTETSAVYVLFLVTSQDPVLRHLVMLMSYRAEQRGLSDPTSSFCGSFVHTAGNLGDEQHLVFECPALQGVEDRYNGQFGIMPQHRFSSCSNMTLVRLRNSSKNVWTHTVTLALRARHQMSSKWAGSDTKLLSLSPCITSAAAIIAPLCRQADFCEPLHLTCKDFISAFHPGLKHADYMST